MYYFNRAEAGRKLAEKLEAYNSEPTSIVALGQGGVLVGAQIAMRLHSNLLILLTEKIMLPGEPTPLASLTTDTTTFNSIYSSGEVEELVGEYHNLIEEQRNEKKRSLNKLSVEGAQVSKEKLRNRVIILVSDGMQNGSVLEVAADFLKPIKIKKLIIAVPIASVSAVDKMHLICDEICCLDTVENMMEPDHYYANDVIPDQKGLLKITRNISLNWKR